MNFKRFCKKALDCKKDISWEDYQIECFEIVMLKVLWVKTSMSF